MLWAKPESKLYTLIRKSENNEIMLSTQKKEKKGQNKEKWINEDERIYWWTRNKKLVELINSSLFKKKWTTVKFHITDT